MTAQPTQLQPGWIAPARTALLVIDCQVDFALAEGAMGRQGADTAMTEAALVPASALVEAARAAGAMVVFVRYVPSEDSAVAREAKARRGDTQPDLCMPGTRGADFTGPQPNAGEPVISKPLFSAFAGTGLGDMLHAKGMDSVVLAGLTTECCVAASAWDGFAEDFHVFIAEDACGAYRADLHDGALAALQLSGATVAETAEFVQAWKK